MREGKGELGAGVGVGEDEVEGGLHDAGALAGVSVAGWRLRLPAGRGGTLPQWSGAEH